MKTFATVCSGIGAPEVAASRLGWKCLFSSEIEPFPNAVREHHFPGVANYDDMTKYHEWPVSRPDVLIAGTPCQAFSIAGLRKGMDDPRGNLTLTFLGIIERYAPRLVLWENVAGVLSDKTGAFAAFLGGLAELGYGFAYRILDAQFFGVAQRRRRVFVVAHSGGQWQRAAAVLFERESLCGNPPPRRATGEGVAHDVAPCIGASGRGFARTGDRRGQDAAIPIQGVCATLTKNYATHHGRQAGNNGGVAENQLIPEVLIGQDGLSRCLNAGGMGRQDFETETLIPMRPGGLFNYAVRRLTVTECELLQGFPRNFTNILYKGKPSADGPRYRALGNSMAVPVIEWIFRRMDLVDELVPIEK